MATVFEKIWYGDIDSLPVYRDEDRGVMAILAMPQEVHGQLLVFPKRAVPEMHQLSFPEESEMLLVTRALEKRIKSQLAPQCIERHVEENGVPEHAHIALVPRYQTGVSDRVNHPIAVSGNLEDYRPLQQELYVHVYDIEQTEQDVVQHKSSIL